ncbi:MAG: hypothetical protein GC188_09770 [Alphaproteobacteria bacterium]|nr:hypothetical protein [Alphaproteobacteria bacterium]
MSRTNSAINWQSPLKTFYESTVNPLIQPFRLSEAEAKAAIIIAALAIFTYFIFIAHHPFHNHALRLPWSPANDQIWAGRWFNLFLVPLNYGADIPVFLPVFSIALGVFASIWSMRVWGTRPNVMTLTIVGTGIMSFPATLAFFYYTYQTPLFFSGWFFACLAAVFAWQARVVPLVFATVALILCAASYQTTLSVYATVIAGAAIASISRRDGNAKFEEGIASVLKKIGLSAAVLALASAGYWASLKLFGITLPSQASVNDILDLPSRLIDAAGFAFQHLIITQPDLMQTQKRLLLIVLSIAVILSAAGIIKNPVRLGLIILFWLSAVVATKFVYIIVTLNGPPFQYRYNTSLGFLHAFSFSVILSSMLLYDGVKRKWLYMIAAISISLIITRHIQADLVRQNVLLRGVQHDLALSNRILSRMESLPELDVSQTYDLVRIGIYPPYRRTLLNSGGRQYEIFGDGHMDHGELSAMWADEVVFELLGSSINFRGRHDGQFMEKQQYARDNLLDERQPWPHESSVFIHEDTIYIYMR